MNTARLNLIVIRSADCARAAAFYGCLGFTFTLHRHGDGPEHFACEQDGFVFEIYPRRNDTDHTTATRLGFAVTTLDTAITDLTNAGARLVTPPTDSPWGRRAILDDPDGHRIELTQR